jgi:quercetin dioxygenase-like cupin family protein
MSGGRQVALALAAASTIAACGDGSDAANGGSAGAGALGGGARVDSLAATTLVALEPGALAWIAEEVRPPPGQWLTHRHELAFVYARRGSHRLRAEGSERTLGTGKGAAVRAGSVHRHGAVDDGAVLWEFRLARPGAAPVRGEMRRVFESEPLRGIPTPAEASFLAVTLAPRGGRTTVHAHPGPELIYQLSGRIDYQNALIGTERLGPGGLEGIPPETAVQKRNPYKEPAVFLSWFLVDPDRPFAPKASFP